MEKTNHPKEQLLVISAIAPNRPGLANDIIDLITNSGCNIQQSKMKAMGNTFSLVLMASGEWNAIAKLEHSLPSKAHSMGMTTMLQRTEPTQFNQQEKPYRVKIFGTDKLGIFKDITTFFANQSINIEQMSCETYSAPQTQSPIVEVKLTVNIPATINIANLRIEFSLFCEQKNLDATFEPVALSLNG